MSLRTGEMVKIVWEEPTPGTWRLVVMEHIDGHFQIRDIFENTNRNALLRKLIEETVPFADDLKKVDFRWRTA